MCHIYVCRLKSKLVAKYSNKRLILLLTFMTVIQFDLRVKRLTFLPNFINITNNNNNNNKYNN